jgi:hypothetical protein
MEAVLIQACKLTSFKFVSDPVSVLCVVALRNILDGYQGIVEMRCLHHHCTLKLEVEMFLRSFARAARTHSVPIQNNN